MTNEEAINVLEDYDINFERHTAEEVAEAHEMAIKALEQQLNGDCISRAEAIDELKHQAENMLCWSGKYNEQRKGILIAINIVSDLPSVTPQPKTEPQQKTGHWEWVQYESKPNFGNWHCSECRCIVRGEIKENPIRLPKYCPECGAKMQEVQK